MTPVARVCRTMGGGARLFGATALVALVAGCSFAASSSTSAAAPTTPATSATPVTSAAPVTSSAAPSPSSPSSPSPKASSSPSSAAGASTPACATSGLQVTFGLGQGAAGSVYQVIDFTNISGAPCTLFGYPGVALAGGMPVTQIGAAASRTTGTAAAFVTLAAGGTANALLRITDAGNYSPSQCKPVTSSYLQIYPPNQFTPVYLAYKSMGCSASAVNLLSVGVVQPGNGG